MATNSNRRTRTRETARVTRRRSTLLVATLIVSHHARWGLSGRLTLAKVDFPDQQKRHQHNDERRRRLAHINFGRGWRTTAAAAASASAAKFVTAPVAATMAARRVMIAIHVARTSAMMSRRRIQNPERDLRRRLSRRRRNHSNGASDRFEESIHPLAHLFRDHAFC